MTDDAIHATDPAPAPDPATQGEPVYVHCWHCASMDMTSEAVTLTTLPNRPLCSSCRRVFQVLVEAQLAEGICTVCGVTGLRSFTAPGQGLCGLHEPAEVATARAAQAAALMVASLDDAHLMMSEELGILLARAAEVGIAVQDAERSRAAAPAMSFDVLSELLRESWKQASRAHERKAAWCAGWRSYCRGENKPAGEVSRLGWTAASTMVRSDRDLQAGQTTAAAPGLAEEAYESIRRIPGRHGET